MLTDDQALRFAHEWYEAWNANDLERVLSHWAEDAEFSSPWVPVLAGEPSGTVRGKDALRRYWRRAVDPPSVRFEPRLLLVGHDSVVLSYRNDRGQECAETIVIGDDGLAHRGFAHYSPSVARLRAEDPERLRDR
jgi:ketosteroid isomerase-like protein